MQKALLTIICQKMEVSIFFFAVMGIMLLPAFCYYKAEELENTHNEPDNLSPINKTELIKDLN